MPPPTTHRARAPTTTTTAPGTLVPVTSYSSPSIQSPIDITVGPDGALWFTNAGNDSIGRITTDGDVTQLHRSRASPRPDGITFGPDGALWFTNATNNTIGRITTAGTVTHFADPTINKPFDIATGSDGALWFTNHGTNNVRRQRSVGSRPSASSRSSRRPGTPTGRVVPRRHRRRPRRRALVREHRLSRDLPHHHGRRDHALHRTRRSRRRTASPPVPTARCGSRTAATARSAASPPTGRSRNYPDPTISDPQGIVTGPDGALWFANYGNNTIGRVTTGGTVTDFNNPAISHPRQHHGRSRRRALVHQRRQQHDRAHRPALTIYVERDLLRRELGLDRR